MKLSGGKLAALLMGGFLVLWGVVLFVGLPFAYGHKVSALVGQDERTVVEQLGNPTHTWEPAGFVCETGFPCKGTARGGKVLLYAADSEGWYLYFDASGKLAETEHSTRESHSP